MQEELEPQEESKKEFPAWAGELFRQFLDQHERLTQVLHLSIAGIAMVRGRHQAIKVLAEIDGSLADSEQKLKRAEREKELAQREVDSDFPLLHEQATIALWSSLEALVRSFVAHWLANTPEAWAVESVKKLRVKIGDYEPLGLFDRCLWITDLVDQEVSGPLRNGVKRFESLLEPFGLSGRVEAECQKTLFELSQVRHVLVHRRGIADPKFISACPWLNLKSGDEIRVSHGMWIDYSNATGAYVLELIQRTRSHFGLGRYESAPEASPSDIADKETSDVSQTEREEA